MERYYWKRLQSKTVNDTRCIAICDRKSPDDWIATTQCFDVAEKIVVALNAMDKANDARS